MPIFLEPDQRYAVVLDSDKDKTPRPTFYAKSLSMRGQQKVSSVLDRWNDEGVTAKALFSDTVDVLLEVFVGIENMSGELSRDWLLDTLTYNEARELLRKVMHNQHLSTDEKKD